jgi:uncharacterized protein with ParB-like and HNH nuclease domain
MQIKPSDTTLEKIFTGIDTKYQVPHYQRDYDWTLDNLNELWSDILSAWKNSSDYFVGAIVFNEENRSSTSCWDIVDGQQRLASLTVLLAVVRDLSKAFSTNSSHCVFDGLDRSLPSNRDKAGRAVKKSEQLIVHAAEPDNYFLKLNDKDHPVFFDKIQKPGKALLDKTERKILKSDPRIIKAKKLFTTNVIEEFFDQLNGFVKLDEFITFCITRLRFLRIDVTTDNDAYLLFETLNDRGLDLSIADLVKNRLLLTCGTDAAKKSRVYNKWESITDLLKNSRYQPQDFLRFYWIAFHGNTTKKQIYAKIKKHLSAISDVEKIVDEWATDAAFFAKITAKNLTYPVSLVSYSVGSTDQFYAEINSLRYSVCYPILIYLNRKRPELLPQILPFVISYLFRLISIGGFAAGRAEKAFMNVLKEINDGKGLSEIVKCFEDDEITDAKFKERITNNTFEDNDLAKYLLAKLHEKGGGSALQLRREVHLEHVLPVKPAKWVSFNTKTRNIQDWIYSLGNMTLLEKELNTSIQNDVFDKKIKYFGKQKGRKASDKTTAIPMTYEISSEYIDSGRTWDADWINERTQKFALTACSVWIVTCLRTHTPRTGATVATKRRRRSVTS